MNDEENEVVRIRRALFDKIQEEIKLLEGNEDSVLAGFVLIAEIMAPGNVAGVARAVYGFCSEASSIGDSSPWQTQGWLYYALNNYDEMFLVDPEESDDDEPGN